MLSIKSSSVQLTSMYRSHQPLSSDAGITTSENDNNDWSKMTIGQESSNSWAKFATTASWVVNWIQLFIKLFIFIASSSKSILASLADSAVDLMSQGILSLSEIYVSKYSPEYPVGRSRLEALSVLTCAFIMCMASVEVIQFSIVDIVNGFAGHLPILDISYYVYIVLGVGVVLKFVLFIYCKFANKILKSDVLEALAEDHLNDVFSNITAIITASIAYNVRKAWWVDPFGAIVLSVVIIMRWMGIMRDQVRKIVGHTAPAEFIEQVVTIAKAHDSRLSVDCTRAYHFGARYNVEMEIVLPGNMTVIESHDIALALQHRIEGLEDVERAFVHVDHQLRDGLEHKIERQLVKSVNKNDLANRKLLQSLSDDDSVNAV